ncbi:MAG: ribbon-helix-helix domain-containing protein [Sphingomonadales bacterium]
MTANLRRKPRISRDDQSESKALTFRLDPDAHRQLKVMAAQNGRTVTSIVTEGLNYMFKRNGLPPIS